MKKYYHLFILLLFISVQATGKVKLPATIGNHMVLQQNSKVKIWGWSDGKKVSVTPEWNNKVYKTTEIGRAHV